MLEHTSDTSIAGSCSLALRGRNAPLDGLRGIAATMVAFYHTILYYDTSLIDRVLERPIQSLCDTRDIVTKIGLSVFNGAAAVILFFVLSGVVLHMSLQRDAAKSGAAIVADFAIKRVCRILPTVIVCMSIFYGLTIFYQGAGGVPQVSFESYLANAFLYKITMHGASLTLQTELLAIPFLLMFFFVIRRFGAFGVFLCVIYSLHVLQHPQLAFGAVNLAENLFAFAIGVALATPQAQRLFANAGWSAIVASAVTFLVLRQLVRWIEIPGLIAHVLAAGALIGAVLHGIPNRVTFFLSSRPVHFLGRISFSFYLFHVPVMWVFVALASSFVEVPSPNALEWGLAVGFVSVIATIPVAAVSEMYVERGSIELGKWLCKNLPFRGVSPRYSA